MGMYRFGKLHVAAETGLQEQINKVCEEAQEIKNAHAYDPLDDESIIEETWDTICAAEGILRKFSKEAVETGFERVRDKNKARGY